MLYVDKQTIIHQVFEVDGTFPALRRGDHCMTPLNLAQGVSAILDKIVDTVAGLEVTPYYHHFVVLDDVADLAAGEEAHVAEYTNTPDDFLITARKVGYSGAFMDKAVYRKTPLSFYAGRLLYKVMEDEDLITMTNTVLTMTITVLTMTITVLTMTNTVLTMTNNLPKVKMAY